MKPLKAIMANSLVRRVACALAALLIRFLHGTGRWRTLGSGPVEAMWDQEKPFIVAFWHGRLTMMPYIWRRGVPINMLISKHRDGELIARTIHHLGIKTVRGSSSKDGAQALRAMVKLLKQGEYVGVTPDGPRGPRMRASDGVISLARLSGVPIFPASFGANRRRILGSWDHHVLPLPFAKGVFVWGEAMEVPRNADAAELEAIRRRLENAMIAVTAEADRLCGVEPILPAPLGDLTNAGEASLS